MALDQYNIQKINTYDATALFSLFGPIVNGIKVNRLLNQYQSMIDIVLDNSNNVVTDNFGGPVYSDDIGYVAGKIAIYAYYFQVLEEIKYAMYNQVDLPTARGANLDRWGLLLNTPRGGLSDPTYYTFLLLAIIEYVSKGTIENLIQIYQGLTDANSVLLQEFFPAKFQLTAIGPNPIVTISLIQQIIQKTKAGGVGFLAVLANPDPFVFAGDSSGDGFGGVDAFGVNQGIGGQFAGAIQ